MKENEISSSLVYVIPKKCRHFHVVVGKNGKEFEMYKNVKCTRKAVVLSTKPIVIFDVLVAVASSDRNKDAVNVASKSVLLAADVIEFAILGSSSNDDGDTAMKVAKKAIGLD